MEDKIERRKLFGTLAGLTLIPVIGMLEGKKEDPGKKFQDAIILERDGTITIHSPKITITGGVEIQQLNDDPALVIKMAENIKALSGFGTSRTKAI